MVQELTSKDKYEHKAENYSEHCTCKRVAIVGAGPAGCICARFLQEAGFEVSLFDKSKFLGTILPTGGGRCNITHAEYDFKELAKNYPRGEKFLYSIFSRFGVSDAVEFFESIGVKTYAQEDNRIFPLSNSSDEVRNKLLKSLSKSKFIKEKVNKLEKLNNCWKLTTEKSEYAFDFVVIAIGGHAGFELMRDLDINIISPTKALVGLCTEEDFSEISGISVNNILFTHKGISGPLIYKISSINARKPFPYKLTFQIAKCKNLQEHLDKNPHKEIKNLLGQFAPKALAIWCLDSLNICPDIQCHKIDGKTRDRIINKLENFEVTVTDKFPDGEVVTCGGVDLKEVNAKTLECKKHSGLYFCGEVLDIDGFCGGFNLQNCWSTGYVVSESIIKFCQNKTNS